MKLRFSSIKEKLTREKFRMEMIGDGDENGGPHLDFEVVARVLGKGKGTPMLRNGIKCLETLTDLDTETEASDWQGF